MRGRGYIYSAIILFADILLTAIGGGALAVVAAIYAFTFGEWLGRKQMGAVVCNPAQGRKQQKLQNCFERVKNKAEADCKYVFKYRYDFLYHRKLQIMPSARDWRWQL